MLNTSRLALAVYALFALGTNFVTNKSYAGLNESICIPIVGIQSGLPKLSYDTPRAQPDGDGSNGGKWAIDENGNHWFTKGDTHFEELQTSIEVIVAQLYRHFGYNTPDVFKFIEDGIHKVAVSDIGEETSPENFGRLDTTKIRQLRVVAAYLMDWDRIANRHNSRRHEDGSVTLLDFGGALGSKARGQHKPGEVFSDQVGAYPPDASIEEIYDGYLLNYVTRNRNHDPNDATSSRMISKPIADDHPWRHITRQDAIEVIELFKSLSNDKIKNIVERAQYSDLDDTNYIVRGLQTRRDTIINDLLSRFPE